MLKATILALPLAAVSTGLMSEPVGPYSLQSDDIETINTAIVEHAILRGLGPSPIYDFDAAEQDDGLVRICGRLGTGGGALTARDFFTVIYWPDDREIFLADISTTPRMKDATKAVCAKYGVTINDPYLIRAD